MLRTLDRFDDGHELVEVTSLEHLDVDALLAMIDEAWRVDYAGTPRIEFDRHSLHRFCPAGHWVGVLMRSPEGAPVGFEVAMERELVVDRRRLRVFYVSMLSVSAHHRRRGFGRRILEGINRIVFEERQGDLIFSTFQDDHAGAPTVHATFDRISDWDVRHFHSSPIWSRRLDREPLAAPSVPVECRALSVGPACSAPADRVPAATVGDDALQELESWVVARHSVAFGFGASVRRQYLSPHLDGPPAGLFVYELTGGRKAVLGWYVMSLAIDEHRLRPVGQLQMAAFGEASVDECGRIVRHLALHLASLGCFAMSAVQAGSLPTEVLESLGFEQTGDSMVFSVRGPRKQVAALNGARAPYFLDFT